MIPIIRPCRPSDEPALYEVCLRTADAGEDGTALYRDPKLVGEIYAAPYGHYAPDLTFVVEDEFGVGGHVVGVADTRAFEAWMEAVWLPPRRPLYTAPRSAPDEWDAHDDVADELHHPRPAPEAIVKTHPGHLHLNLLPRLHGRGVGRALFGVWADAARAQGVRAAHIGVYRANARGQAFWSRMGFAPLAAAPAEGDPLLWGRDL